MPKVSKVKRYQQQRLKEMKIAVAQRKIQPLQKDDGNIENQDVAKESGQLRTCDVTQNTFKEVSDLIDPQHPRNMSTRDPAYIKEAIKKKEEKKNDIQKKATR